MNREPIPDTPPTLRERKKKKTWESIASGTVDLVARLGLDAVRVEDVCALAEVGRSTFFRYFDSKEAAFVAGIHQGRLGAVAEAIRRRPESEGALGAVRMAFLEVYSDWREQRDLMLLEARIRASSTQVQIRSLGQQVAWETSLAAALEPRLADGPRRALHARLLAATIVSAVRMANEEWLESGARRSPASGLEVALETVADLTNGRALGRVTRPGRLERKATDHAPTPRGGGRRVAARSK
jgi:AcrR family transcriptional regulator